MNSIPTGIPSVVNSAGTVIAGKPKIGLIRRFVPRRSSSITGLVITSLPRRGFG
jgi:hypothetical protein